jgi:5-methylcytosine-specific restriction endonuclease McrA
LSKQRKSVYKKALWKSVRQYVVDSQRGVCAICQQRPVEIVHHKEHLSEINYEDFDIAYSTENLIGVCRVCHGKEHGEKKIAKGLAFDSNGNIIKL